MLVVTRWSCSSILEERRTKRRHCVNFSPAVCIVYDMPSDFFTARLPSVCFCLAPGPGVPSSSIQSWTYEQPSCSTCLLLHLSPPPSVSPSTCLPLHRWLFTHPLTDARNASYIWFWFLLPCLWATWHFGVCLWMSVQLQVHRVAVLTDVSQMQSGRRVVLLCSGSVVLQGRLMLSAQLYWSAL